MRVGLTASSIAHGAVLVFALVSFSGPRPFDAPPETVAVDVISASDLSQLTKGNQKGKKAEPPKVVAEKVDTPKPADNPDLKVTDKAEVQPSAAVPPPPPPPPPKVEEQKPTPTPPKAEKPPEPKPEQPKADEALKAEPKKEEQKQEAKAPPMPPKKPDPPKEVPKQVADAKTPTDQKFDVDKIAALLDKRTPQRNAAAADAISHTASLGATAGVAATLTQNELDALRARLRECWNPPVGAAEAQDMQVLIRVNFNQDGSVIGSPVLIEGSASPYGPAFAESAIRAIRRCSPYSFLPPSKYEVWRTIDMTFTPRDMFRG
jgi:outer membrane biosynthesis protein TonB